MDIHEATAEWRSLKQKRSELEALGEKMKKREKELEGEIINYLDQHGHQGVKLAGGGGTVSKTQKVHIRLRDPEKICGHMFSRMAGILQHNKQVGETGHGPMGELAVPLSDALLFQKTPLKSGIEKIMEDKGITDWNARVQFVNDTFGCDLVTEVGLSYHK